MSSKNLFGESGTHTSADLPNRDRLHEAESALTIVILIIGFVIATAIAVIITTPIVITFAVAWDFATFILILLRIRIFSEPNPLNWQRHLSLLASFGSALILSFHSVIIYEATRIGVEVPTEIWGLYLIPLFIISDINRSTNFWRVFLSIAFIGYVTLASIGVITRTPTVLHFNRFVMIISNSIVFTFIASVFHIAVGQRRASETMMDRMQRLGAELQQVEMRDGVYAKVAQQTAAYYGSLAPMVHILIYDQADGYLKVTGSSKLDQQIWQKVWLKPGEGVTGTAFETGEVQYAKDIRSSEWEGKARIVDGMDDINTELAVPIQMGSKKIGVLDLAIEKLMGFNQRDIVAARAWANSIALAYHHIETLESQSREFSFVLRAVVDAGHDSRTLDAWFEAIDGVLREHLNIGEVGLLRLALGTGYPILPLLHREDSFMAKSISDAANLRLNPNTSTYLWHVLAEWTFRKWTKGDNWGDWNDSAVKGSVLDAMLTRALNTGKIVSLVSIPIGSIEAPVAVLFLCYDRDIELNEALKFAFTAIASAIEVSYRVVRASNQEQERIRDATHRPLGEIRGLVNLLKKDTSISNDAIAEALEGIDISLRTAIQRVELFNIKPGTLSREMLTIIVEEFKGRLQVDIPENVSFMEREKNETKKALLRVIHNSLENIWMYSGTDSAEIRLERLQNQIRLEVIDYGNGFDRHALRARRLRDSKNNKGLQTAESFGILYLSNRYLETRRIAIILHPNKPKGTRLTMTIPIPPTSS